jgi:hypothetical protein
MADLGSVAPNYGAGVGPAYLSGQDSWYSGVQGVTILMVDSQYSGPLLVRAFQLGGNGKSTVTLADLPSTDFINCITVAGLSSAAEPCWSTRRRCR